VSQAPQAPLACRTKPASHDVAQLPAAPGCPALVYTPRGGRLVQAAQAASAVAAQGARYLPTGQSPSKHLRQAVPSRK
jgi:hypothetical protein